MPTYKLYSFDSKGSAEQIRFIFAQAGVQYEDIRLNENTWPNLMPKTPYGTLPVLEVDGKMVAGSGPIARYVAEQHGLAGSNDFENADIAGIIDVMHDLFLKGVPLSPFGEIGKTRRAELKKEFEEKHIPRFLGALEKRATENNSTDGWIYGAKVTYADLRACVQFSAMEQVMLPGMLNNYPALKKLKTSVENIPAIAKWIKERPQSQFYTAAELLA